MPGAESLGLLDKNHIRRLELGANFSTTTADHNKQLFTSRGPRSLQHPTEQRLTRYLVKDLRLPRAEPAALAGGEDDGDPAGTRSHPVQFSPSVLAD